MNIISLQGKRASGKDTAALFIKFLLSTPKFLHNYKIAKLLQFRWFTRWKIIKYANPLKQALSVILNISVERFEDREF